jgi:mRNA interferase YafQ
VKSFARTNQFKRDYKRAKKRGRDISKLLEMVTRLASGEKLEPRHKDHTLGGEYSDCRECHIEPDWLLIYRFSEEELVLIRTGSHSDLFE